MPTLAGVVEHTGTTARSAYRYQFTPKHHGADQNAAQWLPDLSLEQEFSIFDEADQHELCDEDGNLYGVLRTANGDLEYIGVWDEQVAEFPVARTGTAWHGYPVYPLAEIGPVNRRGQSGGPAKVVFDKMLHAGVIGRQQRGRLLKGKHA